MAHPIASNSKGSTLIINKTTSASDVHHDCFGIELLVSSGVTGEIAVTGCEACLIASWFMTADGKIKSTRSGVIANICLTWPFRFWACGIPV